MLMSSVDADLFNCNVQRETNRNANKMETDWKWIFEAWIEVTTMNANIALQGIRKFK